MKIISLITILLLMLNCKPNTKEPKKMDNNTVEYKAFMKQENRIELNGCTLKYNETPIKIGMSLSEVKSVLGNESKVYSNEYYEKNTKKYYWSSKGIEITISNFLVTHIYIYIYKKHIFRISRY